MMSIFREFRFGGICIVRQIPSSIMRSDGSKEWRFMK